MVRLYRGNDAGNRSYCILSFVIYGAILISMLFTGCAASTQEQRQPAKDQIARMESEWGIRLEGVRITAAGHLIDFRFRVLDSEKAQGLMIRGEQAYLLDEKSGIKLPVPLTKVGQLRGTGTQPKAGRVYPVMFKNENGIVQKGNAVTVVIGGFRAENLIVQ